jgi:hypothetical protein
VKRLSGTKARNFTKTRNAVGADTDGKRMREQCEKGTEQYRAALERADFEVGRHPMWRSK